MKHDVFMNVASVLYIVCYIPELYANYKNKNANVYNIPEKIVILIGTAFACTYAILEEEPSLIANYGPILVLDTIALLMRLYYVYKNTNQTMQPIQDEV